MLPLLPLFSCFLSSSEQFPYQTVTENVRKRSITALLKSVIPAFDTLNFLSCNRKKQSLPGFLYNMAYINSVVHKVDSRAGFPKVGDVAP